MPDSKPAMLGLTRFVLRALIVLNWVFAAIILALLAWSFIIEDQLFAMLGTSSEASPALVWGMRAVALIGVAAAPINHVVLRRTLAIVDTVAAGDPFVAANAMRLQTVAWALLGLALMQICAATIARAVSTAKDPFEVGLPSTAGWLAILLAFVLARVFAHGARMREELEATI